MSFPHYGYARVTHELKHKECHVNHKKVLRLMRESDLLRRVRRRWVRTTDSKHRFPKYPNLIKGMVISRLNQLWLSDITYIRIWTGFVYLAAILAAVNHLSFKQMSYLWGREDAIASSDITKAPFVAS